MNNFCRSIFFLLIFFPFSIHCEEIFIESNELKISDNPLETIFTGKVYAFDNEIKLWSDTVSIFYTETDNEIEVIKSFGNTRLIRENQEILSDYIEYKVLDQKIYALGNITLIQDNNTIKGNELNIDLTKSTSIMIGIENKRVNVKINKSND